MSSKSMGRRVLAVAGGAAVDNDDALHHYDAIDYAAAFSDGEEHQPHRRQPVHTPGPSAWGANGSAGPTPGHQWRPLDIGCRLFSSSCSAVSPAQRRLAGGN